MLHPGRHCHRCGKGHHFYTVFHFYRSIPIRSHCHIYARATRSRRARVGTSSLPCCHHLHFQAGVERRAIHLPVRLMIAGRRQARPLAFIDQQPHSSTPTSIFIFFLPSRFNAFECACSSSDMQDFPDDEDWLIGAPSPPAAWSSTMPLSGARAGRILLGAMACVLLAGTPVAAIWYKDLDAKRFMYEQKDAKILMKISKMKRKTLLTDRQDAGRSQHIWRSNPLLPLRSTPACPV